MARCQVHMCGCTVAERPVRRFRTKAHLCNCRWSSHDTACRWLQGLSRLHDDMQTGLGGNRAVWMLLFDTGRPS